MQQTLHAAGVAFSIADLQVYWYGIFTALGYLIAIGVYLLTLHFRYKVSVEPGFYFVFLAIPVILLGARVWSYIIGDATDIRQFFNFRNGGLAVQGGVVFGAIAGIIFFPLILMKKSFHKRIVENGNVYIVKPSVWIYADAIIPTILLGQAIGRWGNFFNGEIFGAEASPESLAWLKTLMPGVYNGMQCHQISSTVQLDPSLTEGAYYQPLFLYESFLNIMLFISTYLVLASFRQVKIGVLSGTYFLGYGIIRMATETLRNHSFKFTNTYVMNGLLLAVGILLIVYCQFVSPLLRPYKVWTFLGHYMFKPDERRQMKTNGKWNTKFMQHYIKQGSENLYYDWR